MLQRAPVANHSPSGARQVAGGWPWLYALVVAAWLFDFQSGSEGAGFAFQVIYLGVFVFALLMFLVAEGGRTIRVRWLAPLMAAGALYLTVGIASGLLNDQTAYPILRSAICVLIYLAAAYATAKAVIGTDPGKLRHLLACLCAAYAVSTILIYAAMHGVDWASVRFQIVGSSVIAALGYCVLLVMFRLSRIELAAMAVNLALVLASVTRAFLLALAVQALVLVVEFRRLLSARLILAGIAAVIAGVATLSLASLQVGRWEERVSSRGQLGEDPLTTWYTRLSEWDFMYGQWTASPHNFLFGSGFAARTNYFLSPERGAMSESMVGFGHNLYLSMLFNGGLLGGLPLLVLMLLFGWMAFRFLRQTAIRPALRGDLVFLGAWGATIVLGSLAYDMLAATFGARGNSLWLGIGTGLLLGAQACFDPDNVRRAHAGRAPRYRWA